MLHLNIFDTFSIMLKVLTNYLGNSIPFKHLHFNFWYWEKVRLCLLCVIKNDTSLSAPWRERHKQKHHGKNPVLSKGNNYFILVVHNPFIWINPVDQTTQQYMDSQMEFSKLILYSYTLRLTTQKWKYIFQQLVYFFIT